tara:strand:- start:182 stop:457 length:276 start_codon:yes stop_codon:yes gene_type:complete
MPKGQKHHMTGSTIRTAVCPECDKTYRSSNIKMVNKLMRLHLETVHNSTMRGDVEKMHNPVTHMLEYGLDYNNNKRKIREQEIREKAVLSN